VGVCLSCMVHNDRSEYTQEVQNMPKKGIKKQVRKEGLIIHTYDNISHIINQRGHEVTKKKIVVHANTFI